MVVIVTVVMVMVSLGGVGVKQMSLPRDLAPERKSKRNRTQLSERMALPCSSET